MTRLAKLFTIVLPSMIAGGLLFGSAFSHADAGGNVGLWPATGGTGVLLAQVPPEAPMPPEPPMPPMPPRPPHHPHAPRPPRPPRVHGHHQHDGVSVSIHDGKVEVDGVQDLVHDKLEMVREMLSKNSSLPDEVREKILKRLDLVRGITDKRLNNIHATDMDQFGEEMEKMGEDIEKSMEGLGDEMQQFGDKFGEKFAEKFKKNFGKSFGKDWAKNFKKGNVEVHMDADDKDHDDDGDSDSDNDSDSDDADMPAVPVSPDIDADDADMKRAIKDLGSLALRPGQREQIAKLRTDADRAVTSARQQLDSLSERLHDALVNPSVSDADIARYVDQISAQESTIRKARILAWANARRVLDAGQRQRVEDTAAKKKTK